MPQPTLDVLDAASAPQTIFTINPNGRSAETESQPVALSNEDKAVLDRIPANGQAAMAASLPVVIASDQTAIPVRTTVAEVSAPFTRPSDTVAYAVNDVVGNTGTPAVIQFTNLFLAALSGYIVRAQLLTNQSANVAQFRLYLFNTPPTPIADNAPFTLLFADAAKLVGWIDFDAAATAGAGSTAAATQWTGHHGVVAADANLYAVLVTKTAFTPASAQQFAPSLTLDRNG